jgi:hypothetical protein
MSRIQPRVPRFRADASGQVKRLGSRRNRTPLTAK